MDQPEFTISTETETRLCARCEAEFEAVVQIVGPARMAATVCNQCRALEESEEAAYRASYRPNAASPLETLAAIGFNTRKHGHVTLDDMAGTKAYTFAMQFLENVGAAARHDFVRGLYLHGPTGVGKTQIAAAMARSAIEDGYAGRIVFDRARALIDLIQDRYGTGTVGSVIASRREAGLWILDDIGTEKPTPDAFRILEDILDAREGHPTVLTSNFPPSELAEHWAAKDVVGRFRSRIGPQNFIAVRLDGTDRRFAVA